jgi:uncharacterized pyridoxamine 5'-phosphate oxidase family protein
VAILTEKELEFLNANHSAAMITIGKDGYPKPVRIAFAVVDGKIWSSGNRDRVRTKRLLKDPRCTLYVHEPVYNFLALETTVTILDDEKTLDDSVRYFRAMQGRPEGPFAWRGEELSEEQFRTFLVEDGRILYQFEPVKFYGTY